MDKPTINYAVAYQRFRSELNEAVIGLQKKYPIPSYMMEGVMGSILCDIRSAVIAESVSEEKSYTVSLEEYFKEREQELNDEVEKQKAL